MSLLDKIIELRAKSVTPEEFKETWGITKEEYRQAMSEFIDEQYAKAMTREEKSETAVIRAAAAAKAGVAGRKVAVKKTALKTGSGKTFPTREAVVVLGLDDRKAASCSSITVKGGKVIKGTKGLKKGKGGPNGLKK